MIYVTHRAVSDILRILEDKGKITGGERAEVLKKCQLLRHGFENWDDVKDKVLKLKQGELIVATVEKYCKVDKKPVLIIKNAQLPLFQK